MGGVDLGRMGGTLASGSVEVGVVSSVSVSVSREGGLEVSLC